MHEMLGNQYFLARKFDKAAENLSLAMHDNPDNKGVRRKLIICYTQIGEPEKALDIFLSLLKEDADFIINTDPVADDCPCPELVYDYEAKLPENPVKKNLLTILGMLWLYCDVERSIKYFSEALQRMPNNSRIKSILAILSAKMKNNQLTH